MMSDVPFGVFLSGGIDSSTNVALMSRLMTRPVDTFTVAIKGQDNFNEFQYARQIVKEFNGLAVAVSMVTVTLELILTSSAVFGIPPAP